MRIETLPGIRTSSLAGTGFTSTTTGGTAIVGTNSTNGLSLGVPNFLTTAMASDAGTRFVQASATFNGTNCSGTIASNAISVSIGNYLTTAMASNRGSDFVQATAGFNGTNISGTIASNSLSMSVAGPVTLSRTLVPDHIASVVSALGTSMGQASLSLQYVPIPAYLSATRANVFMSVSVGTNAASTGGMTVSAWLGLYTLNASTLSLATSASTTYGQTWSSNTTGSVHGLRRVSMPMNVFASPGEYWAGWILSTTSDNLTHAVMIAGGVMVVSNQFADFGGSTTATQGMIFGMGMFSVTTGALPSSIGVSEISQSGTAAQRANFFIELARNNVW